MIDLENCDRFRTLTITHLLYFSNPPIDAALEGVQEVGLLRLVAEIGDLGFAPLLGTLVDGLGNFRVDDKRDLWDVDVLLEVQETHLQLRNLLLNRGRHLVTISAITDSRV